MLRAVTLALAVVNGARVVRGQPYSFSEIKKCKSNLNLVPLTYTECQTLASNLGFSNSQFSSWHNPNYPKGCTRTEDPQFFPVLWNSHSSGEEHADFVVYCYCADGTTYEDGSCIESAEDSTEACRLDACNPGQLSNAYAAVIGAVGCGSSPGHTSVEGGCKTNGCKSAEIETEWGIREVACSDENE